MNVLVTGTLKISEKRKNPILLKMASADFESLMETSDVI
jgi:hypothetical protein